MASENLITTVLQLQREMENLAVRGIRSVDREQQQWLQHTHDSLSEMGAEYLASRISQLLDTLQVGQPSNQAAAILLDLLTTLRVFSRVMTLDAAKLHLALLIDDESAAVEAEETSA